MVVCVVCDEVITQPLCPSCIKEEVATWLAERLPERDDLLPRLEELTDEVLLAGGATVCIKCGSRMSLCTRCYTNHLLEWFSKALPELVEEYKFHFGQVPSQGRAEAPRTSQALVAGPQ